MGGKSIDGRKIKMEIVGVGILAFGMVAIVVVTIYAICRWSS